MDQKENVPEAVRYTLSGAVAATIAALRAILIPKGGHEGNYWYHYDVVFNEDYP